MALEMKTQRSFGSCLKSLYVNNYISHSVIIWNLGFGGFRGGRGGGSGLGGLGWLQLGGAGHLHRVQVLHGVSIGLLHILQLDLEKKKMRTVRVCTVECIQCWRQKALVTPSWKLL